MSVDLDRADKWADILLKVEIQAILLLVVGAILVHAGHSNEGSVLLGGAAGVLRGKTSQ